MLKKYQQKKKFMTRLSVNVNKIATLRNSRGKNLPNLSKVVGQLIQYGVKGITVHPRPDARHIIYQDVYDIKQILDTPTYKSLNIELNVEGYPSSDFLQLIKKIKPHQCTLVPDSPDVLTSNRGWEIQKNFCLLQNTLLLLKNQEVRASLFIDPFTLNKKELIVLSQLKPDRVELYTEAYADAYFTSQKQKVTDVYLSTAQKLCQHNIILNAGHDLNLDNLPWFLKQIPQIKEVSIGHALICESLNQGLKQVVQKYLQICS